MKDPISSCHRPYAGLAVAAELRVDLRRDWAAASQYLHSCGLALLPSGVESRPSHSRHAPGLKQSCLMVRKIRRHGVREIGQAGCLKEQV